MATYAAYNAAGVLMNLVEWDGETPYDPPFDWTLRPYVPPAEEPAASAPVAPPVDQFHDIT